jgi:SAM-dependent methyltransferase
MTAVAALKRAHRATWAAGDSAAVAEPIDEAPPRDLLARVEVAPGQEVLDVAAGTGNIAIRAAAAGARVVGLDLTPELFEWGSEEHVRGLFAGTAVELEFARGINPWRFDSAEHYVAFMETHYGPTVKARERLTAEGRWDECRGEILALAERRNEAADGGLLMWAEYLVAVGHKGA